MAAARSTSSLAESPTTGHLNQNDNPRLAHACVSCAQRKIKCDRHNPCSACSKTHMECIYRAPAPPQRRKRKAEHVDQVMLKRLRQYEEALMSAGLLSERFDPADVDHTSAGRDDGASTTKALSPEDPSIPGRINRQHLAWPPAPVYKGTLVADESGQRYYEHKLLANLSKEVRTADAPAKLNLLSRRRDFVLMPRSVQTRPCRCHPV